MTVNRTSLNVWTFHSSSKITSSCYILILPRKLTKRQRARLEGDFYGSGNLAGEEEGSSKQKATMTEEEQAKKAEAARRRQAQRDLRLEQNKVRTVLDDFGFL